MIRIVTSCPSTPTRYFLLLFIFLSPLRSEALENSNGTEPTFKLKRIVSVGQISGLVWIDHQLKVEKIPKQNEMFLIHLVGEMANHQTRLVIDEQAIAINSSGQFFFEKQVPGDSQIIKVKAYLPDGTIQLQTSHFELVKDPKISKHNQLKIEVGSLATSEIFAKPNLEKLVELALQKSEEVEILNSTTEQNSIGAQRALIDFFPQVSLDAQHAFIRPEQSGVSNFFMLSFAGLRFSQSIFDGGHRLAKYQLYQKRSEESSLRLDLLKQQLRSTISYSFFDLVFFHYKEKLLEKKMGCHL